LEVVDIGPGVGVRVPGTDESVNGGRVFAGEGFFDDRPADEGIFPSMGFCSRSIGGLDLVLGSGGVFSYREKGKILGKQFDTGLGKFVGQRFDIVVYINSNLRLRNYTTMIHLLVHDHQGDAGLPLFVSDGFTDRKRPPVFGEKGEVDVKSTESGGGQPGRRNDLLVAYY